MDQVGETRKTWTTALAVSLTLHALPLLALSMLADSAPQAAIDGPCQVSSISVGDGQELSFVTFVSSERSAEPNSVLQASVSAWPAAPTPEAVAGTQGQKTIGQAQATESHGVGDPGAAGLGSPASGKSATTTFFQVPAQGQRIVYVVDASMSMGKSGALTTACAELLASIRKLPESARFQIIVYNTQAWFVLSRTNQLLPPRPDIIEEIATALERLRAEGGTEHSPALQKALSLRPDVVYFLTDADDLKQEHVRLAKRLNNGRTAIHTIELNTSNRNRTEMPLQRLAAENRGMYQAVSLERQ